MKRKCDWPHCEAHSEQPFKDGWSACSAHDITFLPKECLLCPKHGEMYEEIACNPWLLDGEEEATY
jgi:hypothetical protein